MAHKFSLEWKRIGFRKAKNRIQTIWLSSRSHFNHSWAVLVRKGRLSSCQNNNATTNLLTKLKFKWGWSRRVLVSYTLCMPCAGVCMRACNLGQCIFLYRNAHPRPHPKLLAGPPGQIHAYSHCFEKYIRIAEYAPACVYVRARARVCVYINRQINNLYAFKQGTTCIDCQVMTISRTHTRTEWQNKQMNKQQP